MALRFPYRRVPIGQPAVTAGGANFRMRPLGDLSVRGPSSAIVREALFDPGSDEIILPDSLAGLLGIDLTAAPTGTASGVGSQPLQIRYATVVLRLTDGIEFREWSALVGFTSVQRTRILFGIAHGLQYFRATFDGDGLVTELEVNRTYPGT